MANVLSFLSPKAVIRMKERTQDKYDEGDKGNSEEFNRRSIQKFPENKI